MLGPPRCLSQLGDLGDIGARDIDETLIQLREAVEDQPYGWTIGGLAGAAMVRRAVEPADVLVRASDEEAATLAKGLQPERATRTSTPVRKPGPNRE